jgi:carbon monoxide dehydrogenase subunit G
MATKRIQAIGTVAAPRSAVFEFLSDLENHWTLANRFIEVLSLDRGADPHAPAHGGRVRIQGPLRLRRTAITRVVAADPQHQLRGTAQVGRRTRARVRWRLSPAGDGTRVELSAVVEAAAPLDRLLLRAGGRAWLERRFALVIERLGEVVGAATPQRPLRRSRRPRAARGEARPPRTGAASARTGRRKPAPARSTARPS